MFFQTGELRAGTALLGWTLLTLGFPGELIRDKIDGVFISVFIAAATLTWRLQKHKKAATWSICSCLSPRIKAIRLHFQASVCFMAWRREVAYHSGGRNENKKRCMMFTHLEPHQAENKVMWSNSLTPPNIWMCEIWVFLTFQRLEEWQLAWRREKET